MPDIHLEIGTSSVHRLINCPASLPRSKKAPRGKSSSAATEGILLHTVMENIYEHEQTAEEQVGAVEYEGVVFTKDMLTEQITPAVTATEKLLESDGMKIYGESKNKTSVISFNIKSIHPYEIGSLIDNLGIAVRTGHHCAQPIMDFFKIPGTIRISFC